MRILQAAWSNDTLRPKRGSRTRNTFTNKNENRKAGVRRNETRGGHGARASSAETRLLSRGGHRSDAVEVARRGGRTLAQHSTKRRTDGRTHIQLRAHTHTLATRPTQKPAQEDTAPFSQETTAPDEVAVHPPDRDETTETDSVASFKKRVPPSQTHARARRLSAVENARAARARHKAADERRVALRSPLFLLRTTSPPPECSRKRREPQSASGTRVPPLANPFHFRKNWRLSFAHSQATTTFSFSPQRSSKNNDAGRHKVAHCCRLEQRGGNETERKGASVRIRRTSERRKGAKIPDKWSSDTAREMAAI